MRDAVGSRISRELTEIGEFYPPERLVEMGVVDRIVPIGTLSDEATRLARQLGQSPESAYRMIKTNRIERIKPRILQRLEEKEDYFVSCWFADDTRRRLQDAMERF